MSPRILPAFLARRVMEFRPTATWAPTRAEPYVAAVVDALGRALLVGTYVGAVGLIAAHTVPYRPAIGLSLVVVALSRWDLRYLVEIVRPECGAARFYALGVLLGNWMPYLLLVDSYRLLWNWIGHDVHAWLLGDRDVQVGPPPIALPGGVLLFAVMSGLVLRHRVLNAWVAHRTRCARYVLDPHPGPTGAVALTRPPATTAAGDDGNAVVMAAAPVGVALGRLPEIYGTWIAKELRTALWSIPAGVEIRVAYIEPWSEATWVATGCITGSLEAGICVGLDWVSDKALIVGLEIVEDRRPVRGVRTALLPASPLLIPAADVERSIILPGGRGRGPSSEASPGPAAAGPATGPASAAGVRAACGDAPTATSEASGPARGPASSAASRAATCPASLAARYAARYAARSPATSAARLPASSSGGGGQPGGAIPTGRDLGPGSVEESGRGEFPPG